MAPSNFFARSRVCHEQVLQPKAPDQFRPVAVAYPSSFVCGKWPAPWLLAAGLACTDHLAARRRLGSDWHF